MPVLLGGLKRKLIDHRTLNNMLNADAHLSWDSDLAADLQRFVETCVASDPPAGGSARFYYSRSSKTEEEEPLSISAEEVFDSWSSDVSFDEWALRADVNKIGCGLASCNSLLLDEVQDTQQAWVAYCALIV